MGTMTQEGLLAKADRRAQRRLRAAVGTYLATEAWDQQQTALYHQAERLVDILSVEARWERAKAEMDYLQTHDHDWHIAANLVVGECDDCLTAVEGAGDLTHRTYQMVESELRYAWGDR
jgi:hypothetical protein